MSSFWQKIRSDFPVTQKTIYLDHASGGPLPRPVAEVFQRYSQTHLLQGDLAWPKWIRQREDIRKKVARFLNADPSEITFVSSTSQGMNWIAELLADQGIVLTNTSEFPASTLPWLWRKAKIIFQKEENGKIALSRMKTFLSPAVKTLVTSFVQYATGFRQDLEALGKLKGNRYLVVNATQGFGAFPVDVEKCKIDFLCTNSYKWLMAGYGGGVLYIRKKWLSKFLPASVGWRSMRQPERMNNRKIDLKKDASRYEFGCPSFPAIFATGAAVDYLSAIGMERIQKRILALTGFLIQGLQEKGFDVISPNEEKHRSGIVMFRSDHTIQLIRALLREGIYVSARGVGIRVAPHFYNTFEEIEMFLKKLNRMARPSRKRK